MFYITNNIKADIILDNDVLDLSKNKIELYLHRQIIQVKNSIISFEFTLLNAVLSFYIYALKNCLKSNVTNNKKKIKF